ncbi:MAG: methyl-accepting chemotaxis protein, partial [Janthinobacterium sp.]
GIEEVNQAIAQMDQMTQQNAALVEEAAAAAESMQEQAQKLADAVSIFKLDGESAAQAAMPASAPVVKAAARPAPSVAANTRRLAKTAQAGSPPPAKKLAAAGGDDWEEF